MLRCATLAHALVRESRLRELALVHLAYGLPQRSVALRSSSFIEVISESRERDSQCACTRSQYRRPPIPAPILCQFTTIQLHSNHWLIRTSQHSKILTQLGPMYVNLR